MHDRTSEKSKTHSSTCAWTYDLVIPGTKDIKKKWGFMKVSGTVDEDEQEQTIEKILSLDDELKQEKKVNRIIERLNAKNQDNTELFQKKPEY